MPFLDNELFPELGVGTHAVLALALFLGLAGVFVTSWQLTRALANAKSDERGFVGSWFGWGVVAVMPSVLVIGLFEIRRETSALWWFESIVVSLVASMTVPILVHAAGRAINDNGPSLGMICDYWLGNFGRLFVAFFLATAPLTFICDGLYEFGQATPTDAILSSFVSTVLSLASALLTLSITVVAYREAEAAWPLAT